MAKRVPIAIQKKLTSEWGTQTAWTVNEPVQPVDVPEYMRSHAAKKRHEIISAVVLGTGILAGAALMLKDAVDNEPKNLSCPPATTTHMVMTDETWYGRGEVINAADGNPNNNRDGDVGEYIALLNHETSSVILRGGRVIIEPVEC